MDKQLGPCHNKKIVCLGGGIGTVNLIKGLKQHSDEITVIASMADEGGSAGRLRRLYGIHPPGDIVSCLAALSESSNPLIGELLTYRFPGDRYGADGELAGHKMGNLLMVAANAITEDFDKGIALLKEIFQVKGHIYPATVDNVSITAITADGIEVHGEENIDLGKYDGQRVLERVYLRPENPQVSEAVLTAIKTADVIIAGPGDLYTTILPVLIVPAIAKALKEALVPKIFIVNVANKPFETRGYPVSKFIRAISNHLGEFPFQKVIVNNNFTPEIPHQYHYTYVPIDHENIPAEVIEADLVNEEFPLYHDFTKLASTVCKSI